IHRRLAHLAPTLQQSLLPPALPTIPGLQLAGGYHPAGGDAEVGGDFYDVFRTGRGAWCVAIGEVCGKGAETAAVTALVRYTIRASAMQIRSPARVLAVVNDTMVRQPLDDEAADRFATVIYANVRPSSGATHIMFASAGHP